MPCFGNKTRLGCRRSNLEKSPDPLGFFLEEVRGWATQLLTRFSPKGYLWGDHPWEIRGLSGNMSRGEKVYNVLTVGSKQRVTKNLEKKTVAVLWEEFVFWPKLRDGCFKVKFCRFWRGGNWAPVRTIPWGFPESHFKFMNENFQTSHTQSKYFDP